MRDCYQYIKEIKGTLEQVNEAIYLLNEQGEKIVNVIEYTPIQVSVEGKFIRDYVKGYSLKVLIEGKVNND